MGLEGKEDYKLGGCCERGQRGGIESRRVIRILIFERIHFFRGNGASSASLLTLPNKNSKKENKL